MRDISQSLLRGQRSKSILGKHLLIRVVLTYSSNTYTYTTTRIKQLSRMEQIFSHKAELMLDDTDKVLHGLDLEGYKAVISRGLITRAGEEWVDLPPLWVVGQQRDSYRTHLECSLSLEGMFDRMAKHKAESVYTQESDDTNTVKDLLTKIAEATLGPYTKYPAYTIIFDSEDDLIDTFIPADSFRVGTNETRLQKFRELLRYTDCVSRIESDGAIHIRVPVTSGTTYDNQFTLVEGRDFQNFFNKRFRRRIVSPNYIIFKDYADKYIGFAKDASADLTDMFESETHTVRATSNAQCTNLATAFLSKLQMESEKGSGVLPFVHFGQELYDYVNFVDARAGDNRAGNVGSITELYKPGQFNMRIGFGRTPIGLRALQGYSIESGLTVEALNQQFIIWADYLVEIAEFVVLNKGNIETLDENFRDFIDNSYFKKLAVTERLRIPSGTDMYGDSPLATTEAVSSIATTTATGNGTIRYLGFPSSPTAHGVCWDTSRYPTITDSGSGEWGKTDEGAYSGAVPYAFTTNITGLTTATKYYVRTYVTNAEGTTYGVEVEFTTL